MRRYIDEGEDYRWNTDRLVSADDFNTVNSVAIFAGPLLDMYPTVTTKELKTLLEREEGIVVLDAREEKDFERAHIRGAVNIPVALIERDARTVLKKSDHIIVYSRNTECALSAVAADKLVTIGFEYVMRYTGGIEEWTMAGEPVEPLSVAPVPLMASGALKGGTVMSMIINTRELKRMMDTDERFVLVNVLENGTYEEEHICGSINIPLGDIEREAAEIIDKGEKVIVYGTGPGSETPVKAARKFTELGYRDVILYEGGMSEWTTEGLCTEGAVIDRQKRAVS